VAFPVGIAGAFEVEVGVGPAPEVAGELLAAGFGIKPAQG
jgi:hypothetical protein